jgi:NADH dehydrogenase [ubiquinone] 1 alpha subcomplex assembly factor 1
MWAELLVAMTLSAISAISLDPADWQAVNDDVMGGVSTSQVRRLEPGVRFEGTVSFDHGGGFASARRDYALPDGVAAGSVAGFALQVRGDGKRYRLTVFTRNAATGQREAYHYQARFETTGDVQLLRLPLSAFAASFRGRPVAAPPLDPARIVALGLQISDRQEGPFALDLHAAELIVAP